MTTTLCDVHFRNGISQDVYRLSAMSRTQQHVVTFYLFARSLLFFLTSSKTAKNDSKMENLLENLSVFRLFDCSVCAQAFVIVRSVSIQVKRKDFHRKYSMPIAVLVSRSIRLCIRSCEHFSIWSFVFVCVVWALSVSGTFVYAQNKWMNENVCGFVFFILFFVFEMNGYSRTVR